MRAFRRLGLTLVIALPLTGVLAWRAMSAAAAAFPQHGREISHNRHGAKSQTRTFNLCSTTFESISPCTAAAGTLTVGKVDSTMFQVQNNSSFDDIMDNTCTKPVEISTCVVHPVQDTVKVGRSKNVWLVFTAGTTRGTGVMTITASGDVDLEATDTVTVQPVLVLPKDTITMPPETTYTQSFTVKNLSATADTVNLTKGCPVAFTCSLLTTTPMVIAGLSSGTANVSVTTGAGGTGGNVALTAALTHGVGQDLGFAMTNVPVPLAPTVSTVPHNGYNRSTALCASSCFNVTAGYTTPAYTSLDVPRSVSLVYSSAMAYPLGVVSVDVTDPSFRLAQQLSISAVRGGVNETFTNGTTELYVSQSATDPSTKRLAAQISTILATGIYHDTTTIKSRWTSGPYAGTITQTSVPTTLLIDNESSSPFGAGWGIAGLQHLVFTSDSLSLALTDGTGSMLLFTRATKTSPWFAPFGDFTTLTTTLSGGTVTSYHRTMADGTVLVFSPTGFLQSETNRFGDATLFHYNASNLLSAIVDPIGDSITLSYTSNKLASITDPGGRVTHVTVDASGNLTTIKDPTGATAFGATYDAKHRVTQMTDRGGNTWLYSYDFASTIASDSTPAVFADGANKRLGTHYHSTLAAELIDTASHTGSSTSPADPIIKDSVWARLAPPDADSTRFAVDAFGNETVIEDLTAQLFATFTRNSASQAIEQLISSHGHTIHHVTAVWNAGDMTQLSDLLSRTVISYRYDSLFHIMTGVGGSTIADTVYLNRSNFTTADSEKIGGGTSAGTYTYAHDFHGRLTLVIDPLGHAYSTAYDTTGFHNMHSVTAQNRVTTYKYDRYGRTDTTTLPGGAVVTASFDSLNRTRTETAPGSIMSYAYDSLSNVRSVTDPKGQTYQYVRNALGWLVAQINADTNHSLSARTDSFFYNALGSVTKHRNRNGVSTTSTYDGLARTLTRTLADGRLTRYTYDPNGLFQADSSGASIDTVRMDSTGRVQTEFTKQAGRQYTLVTSMDSLHAIRAFALRQSSTLLDTLSFGYDGSLRLDTLRTGASKTLLTYAEDGLLTRWKLPNGDSAILTYSQTHMPLTITYSRTGENALRESLGRDTLDRVVQQTTGELSDTVRYFAYDFTGRLTAYTDTVPVDSLICVPDPNGQDGQYCSPAGGSTVPIQVAYSYDSSFNRTDLGAVLTPGNRATTFNGYTLTYDSVGNLTHKSKTGFDQAYYWNSIGQLDSVVTNGATVHFSYDGLGRRVQKRTTTQNLRYVYSNQLLIAEVDSASGSALKIYRYYPGTDKPHSVKESANTYYYFSDIGTPGIVGLIDSTGALKNRYRYAPWGVLEDSVEAVPNVIKFASREYDAETNLYYNRARYYDPQLARFLSEDPIGLAGGVNQYAYAVDDPINNTDPTGLDPCDFTNPTYCTWPFAGFSVTWGQKGDGDPGFEFGGGGTFDFSEPQRPQPADARRLMNGEPGPNYPQPNPPPHSHAVSCGAALASVGIDLAMDALFATGVGAAVEAGEGFAEAAGDEFIKRSLEIEYTPPTDYNTMRSVAMMIGGAAWKNGAELALDHDLTELAENRAPKWYEVVGSYIPGVRTVMAGVTAYSACFK